MQSGVQPDAFSYSTPLLAKSHPELKGSLLVTSKPLKNYGYWHLHRSRYASTYSTRLSDHCHKPQVHSRIRGRIDSIVLHTLMTSIVLSYA